MANVDIRLGHKNTAWFTTNSTLVLKDGQMVVCSDGANQGKYKIGDGVTQLSALTFYGGVSVSPAWGSITGTLSNQTDLQTALNGKQNTITTGTTSQYLRGDLSLATFPTNVSSFTNDSGYITSSALSPYLTIANAALTYQPLDSDLTSWAGVTRASGFDTFATTPSSANLKSLVTDETGTGALVFGTSPTFTTSIITPNVTGVSGNLTLTNANQSSGAVTNFTFTNSTNTGQTASTNIPNFKVTGSTKTWQAGTITNQYWNYFTANTAAFASASTLTNSYGLYVEAATAGTNATITNNFALGLSAGTASLKFGNVTGDSTLPAIYLNQSTPSGTNFTLLGTTSTTLLNGVNDIGLRVSNVNRLIIAGAQTSGASTSFSFILPTNTGQTASTEAVGVKFTNATRTWAAGAITTQREFYITSPTYAFASPSTITNSYGLFVEAATAGTNAIITNNYAAGFSGNVLIDNSSLRVGVGAWNNYQFEVVKTQNSALQSEIRNSSNGASAYTEFTVRGDSTQQMRFGSISTGFTTSGLFIASGSHCVSAGATSRLLYGHISTAIDIIFVNGGSADTNEVFRINKSSNLQIYDGRNFVFSDTTGTKIGTATTQKIGFWNAKPIVQPTTAVAAATFVANTSGIANDTATFDGYTIGQVVKALRDAGLLA